MTTPLGGTSAAAQVGAGSAATKPTLTLLDNQSFAPALEKLLGPVKGATQPVYMLEYNFFTDNGATPPTLNANGLPTQILDKLAALGNSGTPVTAVLEGNHSASIAQRNTFTEQLLTKAKNTTVVMNDSKENGFIDHAKMAVRGNTVIAGSHNLTQTSMSKNNEVSLEVKSPTIAAAARTYIQACADPSTAGTAQPVTVTDGNVTMITDTAYKPQLLSMIASCGKGDTLTGSMYDFDFTKGDASANDVMQALAAAQKRGVKLNLMLDHEPSLGATAEANNAAARAFLESNAPKDNPPNIVLGSSDTISHQKFLIKNGTQVLMGSTNWTESDFNARHQVDWLVNDTKLATKLKNTLLTEMKSPTNAPTASNRPASWVSPDATTVADSRTSWGTTDKKPWQA